MTRLTTAQLLDIIDLNRDISHLGMNLSAVMNLIVERLLELLDSCCLLRRCIKHLVLRLLISVWHFPSCSIYQQAIAG